MAQQRSTLVIDSDTRGAEAGVRRMATEMGNTRRRATEMTSAFNALGVSMSVFGMASLANDILKVNIEMQALRTSLETVTGSATNARIAFEGIQQFASKTPYSVKEITDAFIKLKALGLSPNEAAMTSFGNTASAMNKSLNQMIEAVADATTGQFERLKEFGIKTSQQGESVKFTFQGIETTVKNSAQSIQDYLLKIGNVNFAGGMDRMSQTMKGALSNLSDSWEAFQDHLLNSNKENAIAKWMLTAANSIGSFDKWLNGASSTIGKIQELQKEQNTLVKSISLHEKNGFVGGMVDDLYGYDVNLQKSRLEQNKKQIEELRKTLNQELEINKTITAATEVKGITPAVSSIIEKVSQRHTADAELIKAIINRETGGKFNQDATNGVSVGLMQIEPVTARQFGVDFKKVTADAEMNVEVGTQALIRALKQSKGDVKEALARYNWGEGNVNNLMANNHGIFDVNKLPAQRKDYVDSVYKFYSEHGGNDKDKGLDDFYKKQEKATTDATNQAKKFKEQAQQMYEDTAIGKYLTRMQELDEQFKASNISEQSFYDLKVKAAAEFEKATVDLNAYNQALADHKKRLESVSDYNATIDELGRNKQRGAITKGEYSLGVSQANAGLMNQVTDKQIPVDRASEVVDAKNINESEKALTKFNDETQKTIDSFHQLHDSGSMAFDGILGGISAVAGAATSFGDVMSKLNENQSAYAKSYNDFMKDSTKTEADKAEATKQFAQESAAYESAKTQAELAGARQIAGATSKMFSEKSTARKAFHGIEMGLAVIEMAMSAKKMVVDVAAGAAKMFSQSGWAGFAGVAAMMAVMASLGVAMGASDKVTDLSTPETKTTGSVLGDSEKASTSIKSITDTLNGIHAEEYRELKGINSNFKDLVQMTTTGTAKALQDRGAFSFSTKGMNGQSANTGASEKQFLMGLGTTAISAGMAAAGMGVGMATTVLASAITASVALTGASSAVTGALVGTSAALMSSGLMAAMAMGGIGLLIGGAIYGLSKLLGIGKVKFEAVGGGIVTNAQTYVLNGMTQAVAVYDYSKIKKTVKGWFSDDITYFDVINGLDKPLTKLFTGIYTKVGATLIQSASVLGDDSLLNKNITLSKIKLALKSGDKNNADNQKKIEDALNKSSDDMASQAFGQYFAQFQQMGEGMLETTQRLTQQAVVARAGFDKLGLTVGLSGLGLVSFSDSLARAFGGVKELKSGLDDLYNLFTSDDQKLLDAKKAVSDFMTSLEIPKGSNVPTSIKTDADAKSITNYLASEAAKVSSVLDVFKKTTNTKPEETSISKLTNSLAKALPKDDKEYLKIFEPKDITTDVLKNALKDTKYSLAGEIAGTKAISKAYQPLIDYAAANQKYLASLNTFNKAKSDTVLTSKLNDLGLTMPDTIDGVTQFVSVLDYLNDSAANNVAAFNSLSKSTKLVTSEQSKAVDELKNFKKSVSDWVLNKQITQVGSPEYQFNAAKSAYESNLAILQNAGASQIDKSAAMSKITGAADAYISKISEMYATGSTGQTGITGASMISGIVNQVASLADVPDIATQQLTALTSIDSGVSSVATAITDLSLNLPNAANDSSTKTDETIKELKQQNATLTDMVVELKALVTTQVNSNIQVQSTLTDIASQTTVTASATRLQALK